MTPTRRDPTPATPGAPGKAREARGLVLLLLAQEYPGGRAEHALLHELREVEVSTEAWPRLLAYLDERGYVRIEERVIASRTLRAIALTADGLDLVEGNRAPDAGIELLR